MRSCKEILSGAPLHYDQRSSARFSYRTPVHGSLVLHYLHGSLLQKADPPREALHEEQGFINGFIYAMQLKMESCKAFIDELKKVAV